MHGGVGHQPHALRHLRRHRSHRDAVPRAGRAADRGRSVGAHLPFHPELPTWAMDAGADVCVTSVHKMGSGLEQSSVFHLQGDLVTAQTLASRADLLGTTSPSVLIYAALDGWRRQMVEHGRELMDEALSRARRVRAAIEDIGDLHVNDRDDFCGEARAFDMDPLQIFIDLSGVKLSGYEAADWMRRYHRINLHTSDHRRINAQLTHADDETTTGRLLDGLRDLVAHAHELPPAPDVRVPAPGDLRLRQVTLPRDAFFGEVEQVPADRAVGRICAEMLTPYPRESQRPSPANCSTKLWWITCGPGPAREC